MRGQPPHRNRVFGIRTGEGGTWMPGVLSRKSRPPRFSAPAVKLGSFPPTLIEIRCQEAVECRGFFLEGGAPSQLDGAHEATVGKRPRRALLPEPPQLRSGQNPTPSPRPIMFLTTSGPSLSNATLGAEIWRCIDGRCSPERPAARQADERIFGQIG